MHRYSFTYEDLEENALKNLKRKKVIRKKLERKKERRIQFTKQFVELDSDIFHNKIIENNIHILNKFEFDLYKLQY